MAEPYVSRFTLVDLMFILSFTLFIDALNLITLYSIALLLNPLAFLPLALIFYFMKIKNSASFIAGFVSPSVYVLATYFMEKAKEQSPQLAKADELVSKVAPLKLPVK